MLPSLCFAFFLSFLAPVVARQPLLFSPPLRTEGDIAVSNPISASFAGFGIESSNLFAFAGSDTPNNFSIQLMQNLAGYSGAPPHIRLGGNTQDYMIYDENYDAYGWRYNEQSKAQGAFAADSITYGPSFFKALDRFPKGTPITYGLNLAYKEGDYLERIVSAARAALEGMKNVRLYSFEIGNEVDLYLQNMMRSAPWDGKVYTQEFLQRAEAVYNNVLQPAGFPATFFEPPATASTIGNTFEIGQLVQAGLTNEYNGQNYVSCWNQHDYFYFNSVSPGPITLDKVMDLDATNAQFAYWEKQVKVALDTGLPYALREMSSVGPIGEHQVSDAFGAALWTLNFLCYAATLDISSVQMHMTDNSFAAAWQPTQMDGKAPFVRPQYYAHVAMAQIIGNGNGTTQLAALSTNDVDPDYRGRIRAYAAYTQGDLQSFILINSKPSNASVQDKPTYRFELDWSEWVIDQTVYISYLTAPGADSLTGATFNGMSFSDETGKMQRTIATSFTSRTSRIGTVSVALRDSEAAVVSLGRRLGDRPVVTQTEGFVPAPKKKSGAQSKTSGACAASWAGAITTALALASCATGFESPKETGENEEKTVAESKGGGGWGKSVLVCLPAIAVGVLCVV